MIASASSRVSATRQHAEALIAEVGRRFARESADLRRGEQVVEFRPSGVDKGLIVTRLFGGMSPSGSIAAIGDDTTDEDMFAACRQGASAFTWGLGRVVPVCGCGMWWPAGRSYWGCWIRRDGLGVPPERSPFARRTTPLCPPMRRGKGDDAARGSVGLSSSGA
jgi:hypothetical protein